MALFSYQNNCSAEIFCISFKCKWKICVSLGEPERVGENWLGEAITLTYDQQS